MYEQKIIDNFIGNCKKDKQYIFPGLEGLKKQERKKAQYSHAS